MQTFHFEVHEMENVLIFFRFIKGRFYLLFFPARKILLSNSLPSGWLPFLTNLLFPGSIREFVDLTFLLGFESFPELRDL